MEKINSEEKPNIDTSLAWEAYWNKASRLSNLILWDCDPKLAVARDLSRFKNLMDSQLPLIDFACGNGRQTLFLADHFIRVIGVDVSKSALEMAKAQQNALNIEYRVLDGLKPQQAEALHSEIGDANIYMRGAFHHIPVERRYDCAKSLQILLGNQGIIYLIEISTKAINYFNSLRAEMKYKNPHKERTILFEHGIRPGTVALKDIVNFFSEFEVLKSGEDFFDIAVPLPNGDYPKLPALYTVMKHKPVLPLSEVTK
ncbi:MAG: class I SAM-dependent methyltransferase [Symploca sp. SIO3C6]|nr:class I SAM-dependent methyltransferase [Symploca sp. SIO3C6]NET03479.1 class I SAM-dependent methyltransferase [Symploca sp. SIO2B6]NET53711.1 class I SAM-dependent methyltransferase [Merismopedia sp. SIO2A8]